MFYKTAVLKNSAIFTRKYLCWGLSHKVVGIQAFIKMRFQHRCFAVSKFLRKPILKNFCVQLLLKLLLFLESYFQNDPDSVIIQKYQSYSSQSFRNNSAHMPFFYSTPTISFQPRSRILIIHRKSKRL